MVNKYLKVVCQYLHPFGAPAVIVILPVWWFSDIEGTIPTSLTVIFHP